MRIVIVCFGILASVVLLFTARFTVSLPAQEYSCLKARVFLVDRKNVELRREHLIAFRLPVDTPYFMKNSRWIKKLVGMPGDTVSVTSSGVKIEDKFYPNNINQLLYALKIESGDEYFQTFTLKQDQYFVIGETPLSYDSRIWGTISADDFIGTAYAIF